MPPGVGAATFVFSDFGEGNSRALLLELALVLLSSAPTAGAGKPLSGVAVALGTATGPLALIPCSAWPVAGCDGVTGWLFGSALSGESFGFVWPECRVKTKSPVNSRIKAASAGIAMRHGLKSDLALTGAMGLVAAAEG